MMQTARVNLKVLDINDKDNPAKRLSYRGYLQAWIDFRKLTKLRYYEHRLQKLMTRLHVVEMYVMAMEKGISEDIINIIKKAKTIDDNALIETLIKKCKLTDIQAKFFINCELKKLSMGYYNGFKQEQAKLKKDVKECSDIVLTDGAIEQIIIDELTDIKAKFGEPRKCKLISESEVNGVAAGMFKIVLTENNFIKKIGIDDNIIKPKNDNVKFVINGDNSKDLLLFDEFGKVFDIPINKIPFADKNSNGIDIRLINKYINSNITTVIYQPIMEQYNKGFIVTLTKDGFVKRMTTTDFLSVPASGIVYCKLDGDDRIIDILLFNNNAEIVVYGNKKALRIDINDIPILKRNSRGCISMSSKTTQVEGMSVISKSFKDIVVVTKNGYINKIIPDCVQKGRSKAGSNVIKLGKTDNITSIYGVNPTDTLIVTLAPTGEIIEVPVSSIPSGTSISTGTKMIKGGEVVRVYKKGN
jgi:DNA gyrase subunit A